MAATKRDRLALIRTLVESGDVSTKTEFIRALGVVQRVVVKVGSAVIAGRGRLRPKRIATLIHDINTLRHRGLEVVMVVSGAVGAGYHSLGLKRPPRAVVERQAAASVGQHRLIAALAKACTKHRIHVAQLLMSAEDIENRRRFLSARHTLQTLLARGVLPIINENDALSDDEAKVGDNDHLAALVTNLVSAQLLVILSQVQGIHSDGGTGPVIPRVEVGSAIDEHVGGTLSETGVGGMIAKVSAARLVSDGGVPAVIADGTEPGLLPRILAGEEIGTMFLPGGRKMNARKRWIAFRTRSRGEIRVDAGATSAILHNGASLLPSGIVEVRGRFDMGARVDVRDQNGVTFAVGLASYPSEDVRRLQGKQASEIMSVLGYEYVKEIIHRDDMVVLK